MLEQRIYKDRHDTTTYKTIVIYSENNGAGIFDTQDQSRANMLEVVMWLRMDFEGSICSNFEGKISMKEIFEVTSKER